MEIKTTLGQEALARRAREDPAGSSFFEQPDSKVSAVRAQRPLHAYFPMHVESQCLDKEQYLQEISYP